MSVRPAQVEITDSARDDLFDIRAFLEAENLSASIRYERLFSEAFALLGRFPRAGRERPDLPRPHLRSWPVWPYVLLHVYQPPTVFIVRVVHGARHLPDLV